MRSTPLQPCRRHGKKRGNGAPGEDGLQDQPPQIPTPQPPPPVTPQPPMHQSKDSPKPKSRNRSKSGCSRSQTPVNQTQMSSQTPPIQNLPNQQSAFTSPGHQQNNSSSPQTQLPGTPTQNGNNSSTLLDMASMIENFTDGEKITRQITRTSLTLFSVLPQLNYNRIKSQAPFSILLTRTTTKPVNTSTIVSSIISGNKTTIKCVPKKFHQIQRPVPEVVTAATVTPRSVLTFNSKIKRFSTQTRV